MLIKLVSIAPEDGWAFVVIDGRFYLVKPPYETEKFLEVTPNSYLGSIHMGGFLAEEREFDGWEQLFGYLRDRLLEVRPEIARVDVHELRRRFVLVSSLDDLQAALGFVRDKLIPKKKS